MQCPHCHSQYTTQLQRQTQLGYPVFSCRDCKHTFNERTGSPFNYLEVPTDIVFQALMCRFRFKLSFRDIAEFFQLRGFSFTHETVRDWQVNFAAIFREKLRAKRRNSNKVSRVWHVDETYVKVKGKWCYLYRGIDQDGNLVDAILSEHRDLNAARDFFRQAAELIPAPEKVKTDGHKAYPNAIKKELGEQVEHQVSRSVDNLVEQSHRKTKQRYYPMMGFGEFKAAKEFCETFEEVNQYFRTRDYMGEKVPLSKQRADFEQKLKELENWILSA